MKYRKKPVKQKIEDDLTRNFVIYQWRLDNPWPQPDETFEVMRLKYLNDPVFHTKVQTMTMGVMHILNKYM